MTEQSGDSVQTIDRPAGPLLGLASTEALLAEVAYRMKATQNSIKGRDLGRLCQEAIENLDGHILRYCPVREPLTWREAADVSAVQAADSGRKDAPDA